MPRLSPETWAEIRFERETKGTTYKDLAQKYGVSDVAILKRAHAENWRSPDEIEPAIRSKVSEKLAGVSAANLDTITKSIDEEAERRADIIRRQRRDIDNVRRLFCSALEAYEAARTRAEKRAAAEDLKAVKSAIESLKDLQERERKAYGLDLDPQPQRVIHVTWRGHE